LLALALLFLAGAHRFFHRDPDRAVEKRRTSLLSAADGTLFSIEQISFSELLKRPGISDLDAGAIKSLWNGHERFWTMSVFMSVLDVHINRFPVSGNVLTIVHKVGKFRPLFPVRGVDSGQNERNTMIIKNEAMTIGVVQIAGHLARKIECWVNPGAFVEQGDRMGWIRMGSQVDVVFPALQKLVIEVQEGLHVEAGVDSLATFESTEIRPIKHAPNVASKDDKGIGKTVLIKLMIWTLHGYLYGKIGIARFVNCIRKTHERQEKT
jgi:phosphatidylserine decarboxylase